MKIAMVAAEFDAVEAEELRKALATFRSRGTIEQLQDKMIGRMVRRGYDPDFARRCFDQIKGFGEYGFPESHAAAFAHLVYVSAWLKHYYPAAFAAALLNSQPMGFYAPAQIVRDAREHGVAVRAADVNYSHWDNTLEPGAGALPLPAVPAGSPQDISAKKNGFALRLGLRQIDGMGQAAARRIEAARDEPFEGVEDLGRRARLDSRTLRLLAAADAFRSVGLDRRAALWDARAVKDAPDLPLFARDEGDEPAVALPAMPLAEQIVADYQTLRLSLKAHPLQVLRRSLARQGHVSAAGLAARPHGARVRMAGLVLIRQRPGSAKGVCFITLEDETGSANLVLWPKVFDRFRREAMSARVLQVQGRIQRGDGVTHIVVDRLTDRSDVLARMAGTERTPAPAAQAPAHPRNIRVLPASRDFH